MCEKMIKNSTNIKKESKSYNSLIIFIPFLQPFKLTSQALNKSDS